MSAREALHLARRSVTEPRKNRNFRRTGARRVPCDRIVWSAARLTLLVDAEVGNRLLGLHVWRFGSWHFAGARPVSHPERTPADASSMMLS